MSKERNIVLSNKLIALIIFAITVFSTFGSVVAGYVTAKNQIDFLRGQVLSLDADLDAAETRLQTIREENAVTAVVLNSMQQDIEEIKADVKELLKRVNS